MMTGVMAKTRRSSAGLRSPHSRPSKKTKLSQDEQTRWRRVMTNYAQLSIYTKRGKPSPRHIRFVVLGIVIFWGSVGYSSFYAEPLEEVVVAAAAAAAAASSSTSFPPTSPSSPSMLTIVGAPATALSPSTSTSSPHPAGSGTSSSSSSPRKVLLSWFYPLLGTWLLIFSVFAGQQLMSTRSARRVWEPLLLFDLVCLLVSCVLLVTAGNCIFDYFGYLEAEPWIMGGRGLQQQGSRSSTSSGTSAAAAGEQVEVQAADQRVVGAAVPVVGVGVTKLMNIARVVRLQYQLSLFEVFEITCVIAAKKFRLPVGLLNIYVKTMLMWAWFLAARHLLLCAEEEILRRKPTTESTVLTFFEEVPEFAASASHMILILFVTNIFSAVAYSYYIASMLMAKEKDRRRGREFAAAAIKAAGEDHLPPGENEDASYFLLATSTRNTQGPRGRKHDVPASCSSALEVEAVEDYECETTTAETTPQSARSNRGNSYSAAANGVDVAGEMLQDDPRRASITSEQINREYGHEKQAGAPEPDEEEQVVTGTGRNEEHSLLRSRHQRRITLPTSSSSCGGSTGDDAALVSTTPCTRSVDACAVVPPRRPQADEDELHHNIQINPEAGEVCCSCRALFTRLIRVCNEFVLLHFPSMQLAQHLSLFSHAVFQLAAYCVRELFYVNVQHFPTASSLGLFNITNPVVPFLELLVCSQLLLLYVDFNVHDEKAEAEHEVEPAPSRHWDQERAEEQEQQPLQERTGGVAVADHNEAPGCCSRILSDEEGRVLTQQHQQAGHSPHELGQEVDRATQLQEQGGVEPPQDPEPRFCFSFDSCGWLYVYHWGVASFVHDHFDGSGNYPPELAFSGASGGALVAGCMALRLDPMAVGLDSVRQSEPCQYSVFETFRLCDKTLDKWVPENVHHVNGKLRVLMTKLSFWKPPFAKGQVVTRFFSRKHMIQCLRASSHIPLLAGWLPYYIDQYKGYFIDGLMWLTLFVHWRAFSPTDYITRVSATGIYPNADLRPKKCFPFWWALFPPDEEVLEGMFWQGYVDAMTFFHPDGVRSTGASGSGASGSVRGGDELLGDMNRRRERGSSLCSCRSPAPRTGRVSGAGGQKAFGRAGAEGAGGRGATHRRSAPGAGARGSGYDLGGRCSRMNSTTSRRVSEHPQSGSDVGDPHESATEGTRSDHGAANAAPAKLSSFSIQEKRLSPREADTATSGDEVGSRRAEAGGPAEAGEKSFDDDRGDLLHSFSSGGGAERSMSLKSQILCSYDAAEGASASIGTGYLSSDESEAEDDDDDDNGLFSLHLHRGAGGNRAGKGGRKGRFRDPRLHDVEHDFACEHDSAPRPSHRRVLSAPEKFRELPTEKPFCKYSDGTKEQQAEIRRLILLADQQIEVSWVYAIMFALLLVLLVLAQ